MRLARNVYAALSFFVGGAIFALGMLLLLIKLLVWLSWYVVGILTLAGLGMMVLGVALGSWRGRRSVEDQDRVSDV